MSSPLALVRTTLSIQLLIGQSCRLTLPSTTPSTSCWLVPTMTMNLESKRIWFRLKSEEYIIIDLSTKLELLRTIQWHNIESYSWFETSELPSSLARTTNGSSRSGAAMWLLTQRTFLNLHPSNSWVDDRYLTTPSIHFWSTATEAWCDPTK